MTESLLIDQAASKSDRRELETLLAAVKPCAARPITKTTTKCFGTQPRSLFNERSSSNPDAA